MMSHTRKHNLFCGFRELTCIPGKCKINESGERREEREMREKE